MLFIRNIIILGEDMDIKLPNIILVGIYNSKVAVKNREITKKRKTTMFEIELPVKNGGISYINSEGESITPDMIICAKPGQLRYTRLPYECYYIHMIVTEGYLYDLLSGLPNFIRPVKYEKYLDLFKTLSGYFETSVDYDEIKIQSIVLEIIYSLVKDNRRTVFKGNTKSNNYLIIEKVINYIKENITADLSLNTLSGYAGFSPIHFHNCFKASTGMTLREYIEEQRIKKATNMLLTTDYTLNEIAYECGFSSQSYFSYAFKRKMNKTPREYAREIFKRYSE